MVLSIFVTGIDVSQINFVSFLALKINETICFKTILLEDSEAYCKKEKHLKTKDLMKTCSGTNGKPVIPTWKSASRPHLSLAFSLIFRGCSS